MEKYIEFTKNAPPKEGVDIKNRLNYQIQNSTSEVKIYCLFSIENEYYQPANNLVAFWFKYPTEEQIKKLGITSNEEAIKKLVINGSYNFYGEIEYRIEGVKENTYIRSDV